VQRQAPGIPIEVIVNGADTDYFVPQQRPDPDPTIILMGTMYYYPNIDGVLHYFQTMHEALRAAVPDLRVLIVGHMPPPEIVSLGSLPGVTVTGSVPDVRPWLSRAWVQIVPLRLGGGSRLKIVESMASGVPVVSTTVGAQGLDVSDGVELMLADEPADFVRKTAMLLEDSELRLRMASTARSAVEEKYSWQGLGRRFAEFCADTVEVARARQRQSGS
jgi:glycosyltransferase involved in cell wall biosynthesis